MDLLQFYGTLVLLVASCRSQGGVQSKPSFLPRLSPPAPGAQLESKQTSGSESSQFTGSKIGPIGVNTEIQYHCIFYTNFTYTCQSDCVDTSEMITKGFPDRPYMKYVDHNCSTDVPTGGARWKQTYGLIKKNFDSNKPSEIIATCAFYKTFWYECYGVADCSRGEGITLCAGAAPWRGYYEGSPDKVLKGNITAEAQHSAPVQSPTPAAPSDIEVSVSHESGSPKKLLLACERFVDVSSQTDTTCYSFTRRNSTNAGKSSVVASRVPLDRQNAIDYLKIFEDVMKTVNTSTLTSEVLISCFFYNNHEYLCSFPFAVEFTSFNLQRATGTFIRGS